jgi:hypothetical protein
MPLQFAKFGLFVVLLAMVVAMVQVWRRSRPLACFYATAIILLPSLAIALSRFSASFPRYLILSGTLLLLLLGYLLAVAWNPRIGGRFVVSVVIAAIIVGDSILTIELYRYGRGQYQDCVRYVAQHTPTNEISITSSDDDRTLWLLSYHGPKVVPNRKLRYVPTKNWRPNAAQWLLMHRLDDSRLPPPRTELNDDFGNKWTQVKVFRHAPMSGIDWFLYENNNFQPQ